MALHSHHLSCDDSAPRRARNWVAEILRDLAAPGGPFDDDVVHDAVLCASELVNDSLIANSTTMVLSVQVEADYVRLSLADDCPTVSDRYDSRLRAQLMGFRLVDGIADGWGIDPSPSGRELWALFRADPLGKPCEAGL